MKLISMTDFVLNINELAPKESDQFFQSWQNKKLMIIENYANFLKEPLKLEMFIHIDDNGKIAVRPQYETARRKEYLEEEKIYFKAKEKVFFEGFSLRIDTDLKVLLHDETFCVRTFFNFNDAFKDMKIEDMVHKNYQLTPNAIKRIFG